MRSDLLALVIALPILAEAFGGASWQPTRCATDGDCSDTQHCASVPVGSSNTWCVTTAPVPIVTPGDRGCSNDANCTQTGQGVCDAYTDQYCGGPQPPPENRCLYDQCSSAAPCNHGKQCIPKGFLPGYSRLVATCAVAHCAADADCSASGRTGGRCLPFMTADYCRNFQGTACTYDDDECKADGDCKASNPHCSSTWGPGPCHCQLNASVMPTCAPETPPPPMAMRFQSKELMV